MSNPHDGSMEGKSLATSQDPTIPPDALPPIPANVKGASGTKHPYTFLSPAQKPDELGRLDKFRVLRLVGKGGMGMVFLAEDQVLHRHVALKVMAPELAANKDAADRFLREARAIAKVNHERIVTLFDVGDANGIPYLVMELLEGVTLQDFMRSSKRLSLPQITRIGRDIATGLAAAHRHGVIHRDIKPGNIWLENPSGQVKILDFGLARIQTPDQITSISGGLLGTPAYMSPEQALGKAIDARSDLFSMGTVLYQLCTGHLPFAAGTLFELLEAIARIPPRPIQSWHPAIPSHLAEFIHHLLAKKAEDRPPSALVAAERLDDVLLSWPPTSQYISAVHLVAPPPGFTAPPSPPGPAGETGPPESDLITPSFSPPRHPSPPRHVSPPPPPPGHYSPLPPVPEPQGRGQQFAPGSPYPGPSRTTLPLSRSGRFSGRYREKVAPGKRPRFPRALFFGLMGGLACFLAAMLFEYPYHLLMPASAGQGGMMTANAPLKVDVVFVLDVTGSMEAPILSLRDGIDEFLVGLKRQKMDAQVGLVYFRDRLPSLPGEVAINVPEDPKEILFDGKAFTSDSGEFRIGIKSLKADGGGDLAESGLDALDYASNLPFREGTAKVLILITDAPPKIPDKDNKDENEVAEKLKKRGIQQLHLFTQEQPERYLKIQDLLGKDGKPAGKPFFVGDLAKGKEVLDKILEGATNDIAKTVREQSRVRAMASEGEYDTGQSWRLLIAGASWSAFLIPWLTFALLFSSLLYLGQSPWRSVSFTKGGLSLLVGILVGLMAQGLVLLLTMGSSSGRGGALMDMIAKVSGWTILGALVGFAMSFFLPNLSRLKSLAGGALGGLIGALLYVVFTALFGAMFGRWLGALALGFCVGFFVALVENAFRRWWIEVRSPGGEVRTLNLGKELVSVGSDPNRATIVLTEGPPVAFRYFLDGNKAFCEDHNGTFEIQPGDQQHVADAAITLCTPENVGHVGLVLALSTGHSIPLSEGLPLTAADLPGLQTTYPDGTVALVSPKSAEPDMLLLYNRSQQQWTITDPEGRMKIIDPGFGLNLAAGTDIDFGRVQGTLHEHVAKPDEH